ncbi:hypothetical protein UY3_00847 [Chelonia mydas]|uniref:Ig-like domain-containing protein n=1 Tax=Chelonia mydas TaxID=8469 RepID=M7CB32_CHEMY|nr:hypothetical protein UY3_00847 [Chelonia mydas]
MILSLCLLLPGALPAPILYLSWTFAWPGDSMQLTCSVFSWTPATHIIFCKYREEVSSQMGLVGKLTYDYDHVVSRGSSRNYSCGYEIKDSDSRMTKSQLSPAKHLSIIGALLAPTLYLSQTSAQPGDSAQFQCSVIALAPATRVRRKSPPGLLQPFCGPQGPYARSKSCLAHAGLTAPELGADSSAAHCPKRDSSKS